MSRTVNVNEEFVVVSEGKKDTGKFAVLGDGGKFDTSVIPVIDELQEQITKEVTERTEGDKALQTNIDTETSARISADQQLQGNIEAEASARVNGDKDLEDKIAAEVTARTNGDTQLQANIEAEANTRVAADKDLQDQISKEIAARTDGDTALQSSVDKEVAARTDADSKLQSSIDTEVDARTKADQSLQDQITAEIAARTNADETEANTRVSSDQNLQEQVDVLNKKNAFSNVVVNGTTIQADSQEATIELEAGINIVMNTDTANKKVTIAVDGKVASATAADTAAACTGTATYATSAGNADTLDSHHWSDVETMANKFDAGHSFNANGYQELGSGLILQWGSIPDQAANPNVIFPISFPNAVFSISVTRKSGTVSSSLGSDGTGAPVICSQSTTGFTVNSVIGSGDKSELFYIAVGY
ncbi:MAG: hypothetical protein H6Q70_4620 [Firmicutes bacterium]|nr:hypothetical protein [Bacillota bacterium]